MRRDGSTEIPLLVSRTIEETARVADALARLNEDPETLCVTDSFGKVVGSISPFDLRDLVFNGRTTIEPFVNRDARPITIERPALAMMLAPRAAS